VALASTLGSDVCLIGAARDRRGMAVSMSAQRGAAARVASVGRDGGGVVRMGGRQGGREPSGFKRRLG
jgi:hypothetical protein